MNAEIILTIALVLTLATPALATFIIHPGRNKTTLVMNGFLSVSIAASIFLLLNLSAQKIIGALRPPFMLEHLAIIYFMIFIASSSIPLIFIVQWAAAIKQQEVI